MRRNGRISRPIDDTEADSVVPTSPRRKASTPHEVTATLAGPRALLAAVRLDPAGPIVLVNTGTGIKHPELHALEAAGWRYRLDRLLPHPTVDLPPTVMSCFSHP